TAPPPPSSPTATNACWLQPGTRPHDADGSLARDSTVSATSQERSDPLILLLLSANNQGKDNHD
ncbi:hypothetical protein EJB05_43308, partial [Eragrostis curvula]